MTFIGSERGRRIHREDCEYAPAHGREEFNELHHALARGYQEAICCLTEAPLVEAVVHLAPIRGKKSERCLVCGIRRCIEAAHITPRTMGGTVTVSLCPNHHRMYDEGFLTKGELRLFCERAPLAWRSTIKDMHGAVHRQRNKHQPRT